MARVLLVLANSYMDNIIPIGISLLSACLKQSGHETGLFDTTFYKTREKSGDQAREETLQVKKTRPQDFGVKEKKTDIIEDFRKKIEDFKPDLIGFSVIEPTYHIGLTLVRSIKDYKIPKIFGGVFVTVAPEFVLKEESIDMICVGEGETSLVELADRIQHNKDYSDIQGIWIKNGNGVIRNHTTKLADLNTLPMQDWSIYEKERVFRPMGGKVWISGPIEFSRGCQHRCSFCSNAKLHEIYKEDGRYLRHRPIEPFIDEIKEKIEKYNYQFLAIMAENFLGMSDKRFDEFIALYKDIGLPFWFTTRPETVTLEKLERLKQVGCIMFTMGVEHGNDQFRRRILNRYVKNETIIKAFNAAKESHLRVSADNIVGFPTETRQLFFDTVDLNRKLMPDSCIINIFVPFRGTQLWDMATEKGYVDKGNIAGDYRLDAQLNMPGFSRKEILGLQRTFPLYVKFPRKEWDKIALAEEFSPEGNEQYKMLGAIYHERYQ